MRRGEECDTQDFWVQVMTVLVLDMSCHLSVSLDPFSLRMQVAFTSQSYCKDEI